ncbi:AbrB family transcriptional regulator [Taylorella equigenitalis]|uniref:AbrB family transcriptional regulator n=1 Tax=Taylorella equigenitalis TaxID=29575 RepID=UPI00237CFAAE|nr:AbrB family transcriptional regulator [Taylorella equigenitalis]WDU49229.1 AbrB family transcriptional regulator [Taylorella equigenitalis]
MFLRYILSFFIALLGSFLAYELGLPIPWMLGALFITAACRINGLNNAFHPAFRKAGQLLVGVSVGLYFTPQVNSVLLNQSFFIILASFFSVLLGLLGAWILYKFTNQNYATSYYASTIGGASEMVVIAERNTDGNLPLIASAHSFRILTVVVLIPFIYQYLGIHGDLQDFGVNLPHKTYITDISYKFFLLIAGAVVSGFILQKFNFPNSWFVGTMFFSAILTSFDIHLSYVPIEAQRLGQVLLGWALGSNFKPHFFKQAPKFVAVMAAVIVIYVSIMAMLAYVISIPSHYALETLILGMSPGGLAEMAVTAKDLNLGAPVVVAFQIVRLIAVLLLARPIYKLLSKQLSSKLDYGSKQ